MNSTGGELRAAMDARPVVDVHTHRDSGGKRQAQTLAHLVSYHRAGCAVNSERGKREGRARGRGAWGQTDGA